MPSQADIKQEIFSIDSKNQESVGLCLVSLRTKLGRRVTKQALYTFLLEGVLSRPDFQESFCHWFNDEWLKRKSTAVDASCHD